MSSEKGIGDRLRGLRLKRQLTQDDLACFLKIKRQTYSAYERDVSVPDAITLGKLAEHFDATTDYILGRTDDPAPQRIEPDKLVVPDVLKEFQFGFHRGEFEGLTQEEVDALAVIAQTLKAQRKKAEE